MSTLRHLKLDRLSLRDALDLAVLVEEEAQERYEELSHQMETHRSHDVAAFFRFMAGNEMKHGNELRDRRRKLFGDSDRIVTRAMLFDIEAPEYGEVRAFMTPREALHVALGSERKAKEFFVAALPHVQDNEVRSLFDELAGEEVHHEQLVLRELEKLPTDDAVRPDAFEDDPAPQ